MTLQEILADSDKVFIDVWAPWCGPCKMTSPFVDELAKELPASGNMVKVVKVNADTDAGVAQELGVVSVPAFFYYENGELKSQKVGATPKADMLAMMGL